MVITVLSDIHGQIEKIDKIADQLKSSQLTLLTGDITHFGHEPEAKEIIQKISTYQSNILAVTGNCDYPEVEHFLMKESISLHQRSIIYDGIGFVGTSGSLPCPGKTPNEYTEEELSYYLTVSFDSLYSHVPTILVVHQPPYNTIADRVSPGKHVGSTTIRQIIEERNPIGCFCGHIHEGGGEDRINSTVILNPGPFKDGKYAFVKIIDHQIIESTILSI
jgi:uncharacterized protein